jgi:hypothetical protein
MLWLPASMSAMILIPSRNVYLFAVVLIFIGYLLVHHIGTFWYMFTAPVRYISNRVGRKMHPIVSRASSLLSRLRNHGAGPDMHLNNALESKRVHESELSGEISHDV